MGCGWWCFITNPVAYANPHTAWVKACWERERERERWRGEGRDKGKGVGGGNTHTARGRATILPSRAFVATLSLSSLFWLQLTGWARPAERLLSIISDCLPSAVRIVIIPGQVSRLWAAVAVPEALLKGYTSSLCYAISAGKRTHCLVSLHREREPGGILVREKLSKKTLSLVSSIITMLLRTGHHHYYYYLHSGKLLHTLGTSPLKRWKPLKKLAAVEVALAL